MQQTKYKNLSQGRLLLFDNQFLRKLVSKHRFQAERDWQEYFFQKLNKQFIPFSVLTTPFLFLEMIGIGSPPRKFTTYPLGVATSGLTGQELGKALTYHHLRIFEEARAHYAAISDLSAASLRQRAKEFIADHVANNPFAHFLASDTLTRFSSKQGFERTVHEYLALDELQLHLLRPNANEMFGTAQLQLLKDLLQGYVDGMNLPLFRLLRSIWCSMEPKILKRGMKTVLRLKAGGDLVDTEYVTYACFGAHSNGKLRTVTAFTCDPWETVANRLKVAKYFFNLFSFQLKNKLDEFGIGLPRLRQGHVYVCSSTTPVIQAILKVRELDSNILISAPAEQSI